MVSTATKATSGITKNGKLDKENINSVCSKKQSSKKDEEPPNHTFEIDKHIPMQWKVRFKNDTMFDSTSSYIFPNSHFNIEDLKQKKTNGYIAGVSQKTVNGANDHSLEIEKGR